MKKIDLAYIAGIFDGEGWIGFRRIYRQKQYQKTDIPIRNEPACAISNSNRWLLEWFKFAFGGHIYKGKKTTPTGKEIYFWTIHTQQARIFLQAILPYLKLKRAEAELALKPNTRRKANKWHPATKEERAIVEAEYILMKNLKKQDETAMRGKI